MPLHDPLRIAEDIAVIDLMSGGRLSVIGGIGYRPGGVRRARKDWENRGKLMDECVDALLKAWTGEPFEYRGTTVRVTPKPLHEAAPAVHDRRHLEGGGAPRRASSTCRSSSPPRCPT